MPQSCDRWRPGISRQVHQFPPHPSPVPLGGGEGDTQPAVALTTIPPLTRRGGQGRGEGASCGGRRCWRDAPLALRRIIEQMTRSYLRLCLACFLLEIGLPAQDLSLSGWRMWPDTNAAWVNDPLYLPEQVVLATMPTNAPTGGWSALNNSKG